jgi:hypothetical protein
MKVKYPYGKARGISTDCKIIPSLILKKKKKNIKKKILKTYHAFFNLMHRLFGCKIFSVFFGV